LLKRCPPSFTGEFIVPSSVVIIDNNAFFGCNKLTKVRFHPNIQKIGYTAFFQCTELDSVEIPPKIDSLKTEIFNGCKNLKKITLPNNLTFIGGYAFVGCSELKSINLPTNLRFIGENAFEKCGLDSVFIPSKTTYIDNFSFFGCPCRFHVDSNNPAYSSLDGVLFDKSMTTLYQCPPTTTGDYSIPSTVKTLLMRSFENCNKLKSIFIPASVNEIRQYSLLGFNGSINVEEENNSFMSQDGILFSKNMEYLIYCPVSVSGYYVVPEKVKHISQFAFYNCVNIDSIYLSSNIPYCSPGAFLNCMCKVIADKNNPGLITINNILFSKDLKSICYCSPALSGSYSIPATVNDIYSFAFANCTKLSEIKLHDSINLEFSVFYNCTGLQKIHSLDPDPFDIFYGSDEIFTRDEFYNLDKRNCSLFVPNGSKIIYENVAQWRDFYNINEYKLSVENDTIKIGNYAQVDIPLALKASYLWNIYYSCDWLSTDMNSGEGDANVKLSVTENADTTSRTTIIKLAGYGVDTISVTVIQEPNSKPVSNSLSPAVCPIKFDYKEAILSFPGNPSNGNVTICDIVGRVIYKRNLKYSNGIIDISNLPVGVYIVNFQTSGKRFQKKIVRSVE
jgi:hypothetical protein